MGVLMEAISIDVIKWLIFGGFGIAGWFMKNTLNKVQEDLHQLQQSNQHIKDNYLHKEDYKEFKVEIRGMFEEIRKDLRQLKGPHV